MLKERFQNLVGNPLDFPLRSRMFHAIALVIGVTLLARSLFFLFTSLQVASAGCLMMATIEFTLYYISRYKRKENLAVSLNAAMLTGMLTMNYMFNAGIDGNMLILAATTLFLVILITPIKHRLFWLIANVGVVFTMMYLEYINPGIIKQHYANGNEKFIDLGVAYLTMAVLLSAGTYVLRKSYEQQRQIAQEQAMKLQLLNDEKDKLFSIISHDLNSPMASVKQYLDLIQTVELDSEERKLIEQDLSHSLRNAQYLLNNLLSWARSQMQKKQLQLITVDLNDLLEGTVELFRQRAMKKGITIKVNLEEDVRVTADENMLQVVMRNLLNNAIKFTNINGHIELHTRIEGSQCYIEVRDDGIGIAEDKQASIFSLNVLSSYGTANEKGTGLGLMLCKEYIEQQEGKIWFKSIPWEGTTFYVSLPMVQVEVNYC